MTVGRATKGLTHKRLHAMFMNRIVDKVLHKERAKARIECKVIEGTEFYVDETLICKQEMDSQLVEVVFKHRGLRPTISRFTTKPGKGNKKSVLRNHKYKVAGFVGDKVVLKDPCFPEGGAPTYFCVDMGTVADTECFWKGHFNTACSSQGDEIEGVFLVMDIDGKNPQWMYTVASRAIETLMNVNWLLEDVGKYIGEKFEHQEQARRMVRGCRDQDKKAGRQYEGEDYVADRWIMDEYKKSDICPACLETMSFKPKKEDPHRVSVDRIISGSSGHMQQVCRLLCCKCNPSKSDFI